MQIRDLKVTRPRFFGGYHPTLKLSGIPTFTFIVSVTRRMDNMELIDMAVVCTGRKNGFTNVGERCKYVVNLEL